MQPHQRVIIHDPASPFDGRVGRFCFADAEIDRAAVILDGERDHYVVRFSALDTATNPDDRPALNITHLAFLISAHMPPQGQAALVEALFIFNPAVKDAVLGDER